MVTVYLTLVLGEGDLSEIVREVVEYVVKLVEREYGVNIVYRVLYDSKVALPCIILNEYEPIQIDKVPQTDYLVKLLLTVIDTGEVGLHNSTKDLAEYSSTP